MDVQFKLYNTKDQPIEKQKQSEADFKIQYKESLKKIEELLYQKGETNTQVEITIEIDVKNDRTFPPVVRIGNGTEEDTAKYQNLRKKILTMLPE